MGGCVTLGEGRGMGRLLLLHPVSDTLSRELPAVPAAFRLGFPLSTDVTHYWMDGWMEP